MNAVQAQDGLSLGLGLGLALALQAQDGLSNLMRSLMLTTSDASNPASMGSTSETISG